MYYVAESEIASLLITFKDMVPLRQTLIEMKWPHGQSTTQTYNSTAVGVTKNTIVPKRTKSMDTIYHWLRCRMV